MKIQLVDEAALMAFAEHLAPIVSAGTVIYLHGELGAGKTTLTRGFLRGLGYTGKVKSPTYTLVEPYDINGQPIYHFDLYRLQDARELEHMGIRDYFTPQAICLIEWPEKGMPFLPKPDVTCHITFVSSDSREIHLEAHSDKGSAILKASS